jgi:protein-disulfide isomerase
MKLTSETKLFLGIIVFTVIAIFGAMAIFSQPPKPLPKNELVTPNSPTRGNKNASHYLVEFSDFQCPACKAFSGEVETLAQKYPETLYIVYRYFPLPQHPEGHNAAMAAAAAQVQGKFWEMEKLLFQNQETLAPSSYASFAAELKLNPDKFTQSMDDAALKNAIQNDVNYGDKIGIDATPTFYLDGVKLTLNNPEDLTKAVASKVK